MAEVWRPTRQRLEPLPRDPDLMTSVRAAVHDPMWFLARQWQLGEFTGEDTGSPISVRVSLTSHHISRDSASLLYDINTTPLEAAVERERPVSDTSSATGITKQSAQAGLYLVRLLRQKGIDVTRLVEEYPMDVESLNVEDARYIKLMAKRAPNGYTIRNDGQDTFLEKIDSDDTELASEVFQDWIAWYTSLPPEPQQATKPTGWLPERMEYAFEVAVPSMKIASQGTTMNAVLSASEYRGGHLDWYAFDIEGTLQSTQGSQDQIEDILLPTPVRFPGMPLDRWWAFEDASVDFGMLDTAPEDLGRLVFNEFLLNYSNDWFVLPIELLAGSVNQIRKCEVKNTFGEVIEPKAINRPDTNPAWQMFTLSGSDISQVPFFLAPTLPPHQQGDVLEDVRMLRDESANMGWAIERMMPNLITGKPVDRFESYQAQRQEPQRRAANAPIAYRLGTDVPDYWIPLVPIMPTSTVTTDRENTLKLGALLNTESGHTGTAKGVILGEVDSIYDEEVPRSGIKVIRYYQLTRWSDGSTHIWLARQKKSGQGEGSSGLLYDIIVPTSE